MYCELPDGLKIFYTDFGNKAGKPVIFINGLSQTTAAWTQLASHLKQEFRIILVDLIFQGKADKACLRRTISEHANDVIYLMDQLEIDKINVVGISHGSIIAQNIMINHIHRVDKAVLLSSFIKTTARYREIVRLFQQSIDQGGLKQMMDVLYPLALGPLFFEAPPMPIDKFKELGMKYNEPMAIINLMAALMEEGDNSEKLKNIQIPTLVVHGEHDYLILSEMGEYLAQCLPNSTFELIEGVGHTLNLEAIPQLTTLLTDFLSVMSG